MSEHKTGGNPNFDKKKYWRNRKLGLNGNATDAEYKLAKAIKKQNES